MKRDRCARCEHRTAMAIAFVAGAYSRTGRIGDAYVEVYVHQGAQAGAAS